MSNSTYSFADVYTTFNFAGFPATSTNGEGAGEITVSYAEGNSAHDRAADGSVMTSLIKANNGHITITLQQTSPLHKLFKQIFNALYLGGTVVSAAWANNSILISSPAGLFDQIVCRNVSFEKRADQPYQAQGQMVTWSFLAGEIQYTL